MEIRNALQKIENYLTVVSNLNKTILSEGTMSRDELLLMKKYLYTSIDRIEDIERSLIIDKSDDKSFTPTVTPENTFVAAKEKEIVEVAQNDHIEEVEAAMATSEEKEELEDMVEDIQAALENEEMVFVGEIKSETEEKAEQEHRIEIAPLVESIITEDYSINELVEAKAEETIVPVSEVKSFAESIITEDYTLNKLFENKNAASLVEKVPAVDSIITEDYSINKLAETITPLAEPIVSKTDDEIPLADKITPLAETLAAKFEGQETTSFAAELENKKKAETSLFEHLEQKLNTTPQPQLFQMFDDGKEELHESFANNNTASEPLAASFERPAALTSYADHGAVLVAEKEVETIAVEQLTPSSLNDIFKPQTVADTITAKTTKTLSESIALNDKFIFVRELFGNHFGEYEAGLKQLETMGSFAAAESYCKDKLWNKFNWNDKSAAVDRFMSLLQKRFN